jgi:hypothetical protein
MRPVEELSATDLAQPRTEAEMRYLLDQLNTTPAARSDLLITALQVAVPLHVLDLRRLDTEQREDLIELERSSIADAIGAHGDDLMYGGKETTATFAKLARGVAFASFAAYGTRFLGLVWCAIHAPGGEAQPGTSPRCSRCMAGEDRPDGPVEWDLVASWRERHGRDPVCPECGCQTRQDADASHCRCDAGCNDGPDAPGVNVLRMLAHAIGQHSAQPGTDAAASGQGTVTP